MWTLDVGQWSLGGRERQLPRGEPEVGESHDHRRRRLLACLDRIVCVFELALSTVGDWARAEIGRTGTPLAPLQRTVSEAQDQRLRHRKSEKRLRYVAYQGLNLDAFAVVFTSRCSVG